MELEWRRGFRGGRSVGRHLLRSEWPLADPDRRVGESRWRLHFAADDLDIRPGFAGARGLHRFIKLAKRGQARGEPVGTTERLRQIRRRCRHAEASDNISGAS
jgi:hypothetical protein